jgi:hypothetical protein
LSRRCVFKVFHISEEGFELQYFGFFQVFIGVAAFFVVSLGGMLIGIFWAYLTAFLSKFIDHVKGIGLI